MGKNKKRGGREGTEAAHRGGGCAPVSGAPRGGLVRIRERWRGGGGGGSAGRLMIYLDLGAPAPVSR